MFQTLRTGPVSITGIAVAMIGLIVVPGAKAQDRDNRDDAVRMARIVPGTVVPVRTNDRITSDRADGRIFTGTVDQDVAGENGRIAIPRGSNVELIVRVAHDQDLILDLDSVTVNGQRYAVDAAANRVEPNNPVGANGRTGKFVGGGAALGAILGAVAGGGKGAAIGAGVGAAAGAGAEVATSGREVRIPSESIVTFRIDRPLVVGVRDEGIDRDGHHYHPDEEYRPDDQQPDGQSRPDRR